ncbi:hypothetical protein QLX08_001673 [Tetragonisca angustula]|uniref:Uncharacterized protein n=1 Tax=Tetragonisca angustula TaxID=166442 RepID=A0AAW1AEK6_9HYME
MVRRRRADGRASEVREGSQRRRRQRSCEAANERGRKEEDECWRRLEKEAEQEPAGEIVSPVLESKRGEKERDDRSADRK